MAAAGAVALEMMAGRVRGCGCWMAQPMVNNRTTDRSMGAEFKALRMRCLPFLAMEPYKGDEAVGQVNSLLA